MNIPKKLKIGYQNRNGTYTGKLAYVIYYDDKGKLRKEKSWEGWRDKEIDPDEFDNVPTEGFVLNKKVGGVKESYGWDTRMEYCRVYDPRGFEFEITIPNLLMILENCDSIKGKGLVGEFVYGWDGASLVLVPTNSSLYIDTLKTEQELSETTFLGAKDLKPGYKYMSFSGTEYIYIGREFGYKIQRATYYDDRSYHRHNPGYYVHDECLSYDDMTKDFHLSISSSTPKRNGSCFERCVRSKSKMYWLATVTDGRVSIDCYASIPKLHLVKQIGEGVDDSYQKVMDAFNHEHPDTWNWCPNEIDYSKNEVIKLSKEEFFDICEKMKRDLLIKRENSTWNFYSNNYFGEYVNGCLSKIMIYCGNRDTARNYPTWDKTGEIKFYLEENRTAFDRRDRYTEINLEDFYNRHDLRYGIEYLTNGNESMRVYYYGK